MKTHFLFLSSLLSIAFLLGCGGSKSTIGSCDIPDWYLNLPQDANILYAAKTATSKDMQLAIDKATTDGRAEIGRQVDVKVQSLQKKFDEETGFGSDAELREMYESATKTVVSVALSGSSIAQQTICEEKDIWRGYVLIKYPIGASNASLVEQLKKKEQLITRLRASATFGELEKAAQKYEEEKKIQGH